MGGRGGARVRNRIVVVNGPVPASVLRSHPQMLVPGRKKDLARWINEELGLKPYKGVGKNHPGIDRLVPVDRPPDGRKPVGADQ